MNVLLITFSFPPAGGVGVLRALESGKVSSREWRSGGCAHGSERSICRQGHGASAAGTRERHSASHLDIGSAVLRCERLKKGISTGGGKATGNSAVKRGNLLKQFIGNLLLPDPQVGWLPFAFPAAEKIIRDRKIDSY